MADYRYEVAFSFLAQDEPLALELSGLLAERMSTFVYSKQQEAIAGTDGEVAFTAVFGEQSRLVVVLHRAGWGETPWTRIEQTAIRNRAFDNGYDFVLFISLDNAAMPKWLPKTQIWLGYERWGIEHAASTIEAKVAQIGGSVTQETAVQKAERLGREHEAENERLTFLGSKEGVDAALTELGCLFDSFQQMTTRMKSLMPGTQIHTHREATRLIVNCGGMAITVAWAQQWGNTLQHSALYVMTWNGEVPSISIAAPDKLKESKYHFDRLANGALGWRAASSNERFFLTAGLADHHLKEFLDDVTSQGKGDRE